MSYRVRLFQASVVQPLVKSNYWVYIPTFVSSVIRAEATSLPLPSYNVLECNHMGRQVFFPGVRTVQGDWNVTFAEDVIGSATFAMLKTILIYQFKSKSSLNKFNILVAPTLGHSDAPIPHLLYQLTGCWVRAISGFDFAAASPGEAVKLQVSFKYDNIENITLNSSGADPFNIEKV